MHKVYSSLPVMDHESHVQYFGMQECGSIKKAITQVAIQYLNTIKLIVIEAMQGAKNQFFDNVE